ELMLLDPHGHPADAVVQVGPHAANDSIVPTARAANPIPGYLACASSNAFRLIASWADKLLSSTDATCKSVPSGRESSAPRTGAGRRTQPETGNRSCARLPARWRRRRPGR